MKKILQRIPFVCSILLFELTYACSTCYGDPNSDAGKGMDMAMITLVGVRTPLLIAIAIGIVSIGLKSKKLNNRP